MLGGEVVRLAQGVVGERTTYAADPVETAREWERAGAEWLHLVDLDGATGSGFDNSPAISKILENSGVPVQLGGGIRSLEAISGWIERGVARVCVGTKLLDPSFREAAVRDFGEWLVGSVDARGGTVRLAGWKQASQASTLETVRSFVDAGVRRIMFTDIERDGMLSGPNLEAVEEVLMTAQLPVIAAGGVSTEQDVRALARLAPKGLEGIVIGKALYSGHLTLQAAQSAAAGRG
jgi:phosphoribosylformimino-5-aminoimidazole carboxamide ribotide isomerase